MATKKRSRVARAKMDALLEDALVSGLRHAARAEQTQSNLLEKILGELSLIRAVLEKPRRRKGKAIK